jgi:hypothetical protein
MVNGIVRTRSPDLEPSMISASKTTRLSPTDRNVLTDLTNAVTSKNCWFLRGNYKKLITLRKICRITSWMIIQVSSLQRVLIEMAANKNFSKIKRTLLIIKDWFSPNCKINFLRRYITNTKWVRE